MKIAGTCDQCKWWGDKNEPVFHYGVGEDGKLIGFEQTHRVCQHPKIKLDRDGDRDELDGVQDWGNDAGYQDLATGPKFGCIHWEKKK